MAANITMGTKYMNYKFAPAFLTKSLSRFYDPVTALIGAGDRLQKLVLEVGNIQENDNVLDVGCGTGRFLLLAKQARLNAKLTGLDPDNDILKVAREKFAEHNVDIPLVNAFAEQMPLPSEGFDKVFSTLAFHHTPREVKKAALLEIKRVLKPNGVFYLSDFGVPANFFWKIVLYVEALFEPKAYIKDNLEGEIPKLLQETGFSFEETRPHYRGIRFYCAHKG